LSPGPHYNLKGDISAWLFADEWQSVFQEHGHHDLRISLKG
jgi:hypothetical protein